MYQQGSKEALNHLSASDALVKFFLDLVAVDTQSNPNSTQIPSSQGQYDLGKTLTALAGKWGFDAQQDEHGVVTVKVKPSSGFEAAKKLCLLAHLDTAPDASGNNVQPALVTNYQGQGIKLENGLILDDAICGSLINHVGDDIIVTDGSTLLGADDKAGVACLLWLLYNISTNSAIKHGALTIVFSVDEELGNSSSYLDLNQIACDFGVTVDGGEVGDLDVATFNAASAKIKFYGRSVHTGNAYKTLINAVSLACRFEGLLPPNEKPENTREQEGFFHICSMRGSVESAEISMIIRDFSKAGLERRCKRIKDIAAFICAETQTKSCVADIVPQYENMHEVLEKHPLIVKLCTQAFDKVGIKVNKCSVRGGTDGSNLSARGLPCPNIFTGGLNYHGPYECLPVQSLHKAYRVIEELVSLVAANRLA